jgi:hypothetical protein
MLKIIKCDFKFNHANSVNECHVTYSDNTTRIFTDTRQIQQVTEQLKQQQKQFLTESA